MSELPECHSIKNCIHKIQRSIDKGSLDCHEIKLVPTISEIIQGTKTINLHESFKTEHGRKYHIRNQKHTFIFRRHFIIFHHQGCCVQANQTLSMLNFYVEYAEFSLYLMIIVVI